MKKIIYYRSNGDFDHEECLNETNLSHINGMMIKCYLKDKKIQIGYGDPYRTHDKDSYDGEVHDYINLWTWDNLDEEKHQLIGNDNNKYNQTFTRVYINSIISIDVIIYSNPRWGGKLTNMFEFHKSDTNQDRELYIPKFLKIDSDCSE